MPQTQEHPPCRERPPRRSAMPNCCTQGGDSERHGGRSLHSEVVHVISARALRAHQSLFSPLPPILAKKALMGPGFSVDSADFSAFGGFSESPSAALADSTLKRSGIGLLAGGCSPPCF